MKNLALFRQKFEEIKSRDSENKYSYEIVSYEETYTEVVVTIQIV